MTRLEDQFETHGPGGLQVTDTLQTESGHKYHIVRLSRWSAGIIVDGADNLSLTFISEGDGDIGKVIADKVTVAGIIQLGVDIYNALSKGLGGKGGCYTQNQQTVTWDKNGNVASSTNTVTVVCPT